MKAPSTPAQPLTDVQIAALRAQYGITSNGRGIKEFTQVRDFARAAIAQATTATPTMTDPEWAVLQDNKRYWQERALRAEARAPAPVGVEQSRIIAELRSLHDSIAPGASHPNREWNSIYRDGQRAGIKQAIEIVERTPTESAAPIAPASEVEEL
jgi:hypothetical protein